MQPGRRGPKQKTIAANNNPALGKKQNTALGRTETIALGIKKSRGSQQIQGPGAKTNPGAGECGRQPKNIELTVEWRRQHKYGAAGKPDLNIFVLSYWAAAKLTMRHAPENRSHQKWRSPWGQTKKASLGAYLKDRPEFEISAFKRSLIKVIAVEFGIYATVLKVPEQFQKQRKTLSFKRI